MKTRKNAKTLEQMLNEAANSILDRALSEIEGELRAKLGALLGTVPAEPKAKAKGKQTASTVLVLKARCACGHSYVSHKGRRPARRCTGSGCKCPNFIKAS